MVANNTQALLDLISKRAKIAQEFNEQVAELDRDIVEAAAAAGIGLGVSAPTPTITLNNGTSPSPSASTRRPGRPKGSKNKSGAGRGPGRPKGSKNRTGQPPLEDVLTQLAQRHKHGLELHELVTKAKESGYKTESSNFKNMVQQAVGRLIKKKVFVKDTDTMRYTYREVA